MKESSLGEISVQNSGFQAIKNDSKIDDFFSPLNEKTKQKWPFDFSKEGYQTTYQQTIFIPSRDPLLDPGEGIRINALISNGQESFFMSQEFYFYGDSLTIYLKNLYRIGFGKPSKFAFLTINKIKEFMITYDADRPYGKTDPSKLELKAVSNNDKSNIASIGGYVWANMGFEFKNDDTKHYLQQRFKTFAHNHNIEISSSDLKYFTKPCHFAAFDCGVKIIDKLGHSSSLGKAFMFFETWDGIIYSDKNKDEATRYAQMYNNPQTHLKSQKALNNGYRSIVNKYTKRYSDIQTNKFICLKHLMLRKILFRF